MPRAHGGPMPSSASRLPTAGTCPIRTDHEQRAHTDCLGGRIDPGGCHMALGYDKRLFLLAFDHRSSFEKGFFGATPPLSTEVRDSIIRVKEIIFEANQLAVEAGAPRDLSGILVDEEFGTAVARRAKEVGTPLAMPVERSGQDEFQFQYGDQFGDHIESFDPTFVKVLVRYNPEGKADLNERQTERLAILSDWLRARDRKFLFEL